MRYLTVITFLLLGFFPFHGLHGQTASTPELYSVQINSTIYQIGFAVSGTPGIFTSLHGLAGHSGTFSTLRSTRISVSPISKPKMRTDYEVSKIDPDRDLVLLLPVDDKLKKNIMAGYHFEPLGLSEIEKLCKSGMNHSSPSAIRNVVSLEAIILTGALANCLKSYRQLIHVENVSAIPEAGIILTNTEVFNKRVAFGFGTQMPIHRGMSGSPIMVKYNGKDVVFGMLSFKIGQQSGLGIHFDTKGLVDISNPYEAFNDQTLSKAFESYRKLSKQLLAEQLCNTEECCMIPLPDDLDYRYYDPNNNGNDKLTDRNRKRLRKKNYRKAFAFAYDIHFNLVTNVKGSGFAIVFKNKKYKYDEHLKGKTLSDNFFKALYGLHNDKPQYLDSAFIKLSKHYAGIPLHGEETNKTRKKRERHYRQDLRWWAKYGYNLDDEIRKFLRLQASTMACDSGLADVKQLVGAKAYCEAYTVGTELLGRYCERNQDKRDSIGAVLCRVRNTVLDSADMLVECALGELEQGNLECASTALQVARSLFQCVDQYSDADSVQIQLTVLDSLTQIRDKQIQMSSPPAIQNAIISHMDKLAQNKSIASEMAMGIKHSSPIKWHEDGKIEFNYAYGEVDSNKYYLSAFHSGFPPAHYWTAESERILLYFSSVLKGILDDPILSSIFPKELATVNIEGFADGLPYNGKFKYDGEFDGLNINQDIVEFKDLERIYGPSEENSWTKFGKFSELRGNLITRNEKLYDFGKNGIGKNYALSHLRATHAFQIIVDKVGLSKDSVKRIAKIVPETGGKFRKVEVKVILNPDKEYLEKIRNMMNKQDCKCDGLINSSSSILF